ncbi:chromosome segregation protein SMC [Bacillus chungangensis]|uniref:Chromosome partition protein Smc n=1 Tax=Bacillus chungangensis TaxID=587633 RepID=A0ABT9WRC5_9BACI|nr:chromosome segregation protein SMC [Bacillus chungangensis]MDQ0175852.1 chromosome segregation protein [Bacillus chungangensis]
MFLKRIDVLGFKSFAERAAIEFVPGVTAVVGPNGSGKSNITDAIRWVLGEQSVKSIRGGKMEDIIFAGSDSRKPLNVAEVTLTLDNEDALLPIDYSEVSVTRRVFRNGESEFFINKQPCRLKEIVELFMDSGLGREAFSIISQGKVEEILNSKAEDRRTIFEEAAGVLKYKTRKKKAELKLFETEENLHRVNDILHELSSQVEPLKIQASMAKDYLEKKEELEAFEVSITVYDIEDLHKKWEQLKHQLERHQDEEIETTTQIQKKELEIETLRTQLSMIEEETGTLQNKLLLTSEELEKVEGRKQVLKERKKHASQNQDQLTQTLQEMSDKMKQLQEEIKRYKLELAGHQEEAKRIKQQIADKSKQLELVNEDVEEIIESLKSDYIQLMNKQASANNEKHYLEKQLQQQAIRSERLDHDHEKWLEQRTRLISEKKKIENELIGLRTKIENQVSLYHDTKKQLSVCQQHETQLKRDLDKARQYVQQARSRKDTLAEMEEDYTGFYQGAREVLKARRQLLSGIEGAVAELIHVPSKYEMAIETTLGNAMQHIVVETEADARQAIAFLKKHQYGRATFLPLNVLKAKSIPYIQLTQLQAHPAFVDIASSLLHYDEKYAPVMRHLLGNIVIAQNLSGANELANLLQYRYRIVTLEGDVVNPGGSMTGGASKKRNSSLLGRKNELAALKDKIKGMETKTSQLEEEVFKMQQEIKQQENTLEELREQGEALRLREHEVKAKQREVEMEAKNAADRLQMYDYEKSDLTTEKTKIETRIKELQQKAKEGKETLRTCEERIEELQYEKKHGRQTKEALQSEMSDLKAKAAVKTEQLLSLQEQLERAEREWQDVSKRKTILAEELHWLQTEMTDQHSGENELEQAAENKLQAKKELQAQIVNHREKRLKLQQHIDDKNIHLKQLKRNQRTIAETVKEEEIQLNRLDLELENRLQFLREAYTLTYEAAKTAYPLTVSAEEARKKVTFIKRALEELGTVNLGAIEEYERVSERHQFLQEQQNDLLEAKKTLFEIIAEMDEEMIKRFDASFSAIRDQFESVFQSLFGGGRAELRLTDASDLLHTGIEIVAQPPGKKLQNLSLLSGGERALTAIALLFAILRVRPVPFCVLDEVEAALDEANVYRFSQYLKQFSKETQFIVITHRKGTMEEADVLYGVTMQESGVSKLVSVRMEETEALAQ